MIFNIAIDTQGVDLQELAEMLYVGDSPFEGVQAHEGLVTVNVNPEWWSAVVYTELNDANVAEWIENAIREIS